MREGKRPYSATPEELAAIDEALSERPFAFTEAERDALTELLRQTIVADPYPLSPRIKLLKAVLAKIAPAAPSGEPYPAPAPSERPSLTLHKKRRR